MSVPPEGAQISPDGYYWFDTAINDWRPVAGQAGGGADAGSGGGDAGTPQLVFADVNMLTQNVGAGPLLGIDPNDNPNNNHDPHPDNGIQAVWAEVNIGTADAVDYSDTWTLNPAGSTSGSGTLDHQTLPAHQPGQMRVIQLGRLPAGTYDFDLTLYGGAPGSHHGFQVDP